MKTLLRVYFIISVLTLIFVEDYSFTFFALIAFNLFIFSAFNVKEKIMNNIVVSIFYLTFVITYIIKLQLNVILFEYELKLVIEIFLITTIAHLFIIILINLLRFFKFETKFNLKYASSGIISKKENYLIGISFILIVITGVIYYKYDLFIMGKEMIELPYHLNGLMFYSRTIIIPMVLLAVFFTTNSKKTERYALMNLLMLGVTDMILRGSKGALIYILIQVFVVLYFKRSYSNQKLNYKPFIVIFVALIGIIPLMNSYRNSLTNDVQLEYHESGSSFVNGGKQFLSRIQGYSEFYKVYSLLKDKQVTYDYERSISAVYTFEVLELPDYGTHLSSPSLLGAGFIFYRYSGVFLIPLVFILFINLVFVFYCKFLKVSQIPAIAYTIFEVINSTIAGTIDATFDRIIVVIVFSLLLDFFVFRKRKFNNLKIID